MTPGDEQGQNRNISRKQRHASKEACACACACACASQVRLRATGRRACPRVACASACAAPKYPGGVTRNTLFPVGLQKTRYNLPERPTLALRQRSDSTQAERDTKAAVKAHGTRRAAIAAIAILLGGLHLRLELPVALAELGQLLAQLGVISLVSLGLGLGSGLRLVSGSGSGLGSGSGSGTRWTGSISRMTPMTSKT